MEIFKQRTTAPRKDRAGNLGGQTMPAATGLVLLQTAHLSIHRRGHRLRIQQNVS